MQEPTPQSIPAPFAAAAASLGAPLSEAQVAQFLALAEELRRWSDRFNLSGITDLEAVLTRHVLDSLTLVPFLRAHMPLVGGRLVDVGAGAGFPGLALAIALPTLEVVLVEATGKKVRFVRHVVRAIGIPNAVAVAGRAEDLAHADAYRQQFDVAVARAVGSVATLVELLVPFLRIGGWAVLMKTRARAVAELAVAARALRELRSSVLEVAEVAVPGTLDDRALVIVHKDDATDDRYPRRSGVPARRPLTGP